MAAGYVLGMVAMLGIIFMAGARLYFLDAAR